MARIFSFALGNIRRRKFIKKKPLLPSVDWSKEVDLFNFLAVHECIKLSSA